MNDVAEARRRWRRAFAATRKEMNELFSQFNRKCEVKEGGVNQRRKWEAIAKWCALAAGVSIKEMEWD